MTPQSPHAPAADVQVDVATDAGAMPAHLFLPPAGHGPGVVLFQEIFGVSAYVRRRAADLAAAGYVVLVPEIFWRLGIAEPFEGENALPEALAALENLDWGAAVSDGVASVATLRERPEVDGGLGVVGFCFGGGLAFNVAAEVPVDTLVSYYGSALPGLTDLAEKITAPSLHHFGLSDSFIDTESVRRIEAAVTAHGAQFVTYPGADHAFDNDDAQWFHPEASAAAWQRTLDFLAETLPTAAPAVTQEN